VNCNKSFVEEHRSLPALLNRKVDSAPLETIPLDQIHFDEDIYPRQAISPKKVDQYIEALKAGKGFPPIKLQKVIYTENNKPVEKLVVVDGMHRVTAYTGYNRWLEKAPLEEKDEAREAITDVSYVLHSEKVYFKESPEDVAELLIIAAKYNSEHGYQMSQDDKRLAARRIYEHNPKQSVPDLSNVLGIPQRTLYRWVEDIIQKNKASQEAKICRLNLLGWTEEDTGNVVGLSQQRVGMVLQQNANWQNVVKSLQELLSKGNPIDKAAEILGLDLPLAWALYLQDQSDMDRLKILESKNEGLSCSPRPYDIWSFGNAYDLFGRQDHPGRVPGQLILQLLYFFTEPGDMVIDPMAGGGTTVDACLIMGRKCLAFDSDPGVCEKRFDIKLKDAISAIEGLTRRPELILLDPPYYKKMDKEYGENSISRLDREEYLDYIDKLASAAYAKLGKDGHLALLMSDYTDDDPREEIFIHHYIEIFEKMDLMLNV